MSDENKNIFVSHQHNDADKIEAFKNLIGRHGINMRDSSIYENKLKNNAKNEQYIKTANEVGGNSRSAYWKRNG